MKIVSRALILTLSLISILSMLLIMACSKKTEPDSPSQNPAPETEQSQSADSVQPIVEAISDSEAQEKSTGPTWAQHLVTYTQGWIPAEENIQLRFSHAVAEKEHLHKPVEGLIHISPAHNIQAIFTATDELTITHPKRFPSGQVFSISLSPEKLKNVSPTLKPFNFQVQALQQDFELQISGLVPGEGKGSMKLEGQVRTTDTAEAEDIEKTLILKQGKNSLPINWTHQSDKLNHAFSITGITRGKNTAKIELHYSAQAIGVDKEGDHTLEVPALDQFKVTAIRTVQRPKQYIEVSFSEALDRNQNLNGLVRLNGDNTSVRIDGSALRIYPPRKQSGVSTLEIEDTIKSSKQFPLLEAYQQEVTFVSELPGVRFMGSGSIIPPTDSLTVPFEAINVNAVWVSAFKVYGNNIQQFLQNNPINSGRVDTRSGRYLWRKKITLPSVPFDQWQHYDIDLNELMKNHGDGIINLQLSIDTSTIAYSCPDTGKPSATESKLSNYDGPQMQEHNERPDWFRKYYSINNGYVTYEQRSDPCHPGYYSYYSAKNVKAAKNLLVSDIGLIVKKGDANTLHVVATGIKSAKAKKKTQLKVYNYQHQLIGSAITDKQGMASIQPSGAGFYMVAEHKGDKGYLRFPRNTALPTSQFDTGGEKVRKGLKGFLYGERDVWRPGDNIYLTFVLEDKNNKIPADHPVSLDFFDPRGTKVLTEVNSRPVGDLYTFTLKTDEAAPTGNWRAVARVGGEYFSKTLKIETITPNRLKVEITPSQRPMQAANSPIRTELFAQWLNGATAKNLKADTELKLSPMKTTFDGWSQYQFDDPASSFRRFQQKVFNKNLDSKGRAAFDINLQQIHQAPGKLRATFITRVFEQSGNFSTSIRHEDVLPYENWVGINIPKGDGYRNAISREKDHSIQLLSINSDAKFAPKRKLKISVYRIGWRWWWDQSEEDLANYVRNRNNNQIVDEVITTDANGRANWLLEKNKYRWGRHLVRACDQQSGHCTGQEVYLGWSWSNQVNPDSATQLMLGTDKEHYEVGDTAVINIPELVQGKILYSLENGSEVLQQKWLDLKPGARAFNIPVTANMAPNVYVNVVLLLPHEGRKSDAPIRLYGITPLLVNNPNSHIKPKLKAPDTVRPESRFEVSISEENNKKMSYTLAVVDEGLLGITGYNAPDPHKSFYKREALGVVTWDMFDGVLGAYGANLQRLLRIGGGDKGKKGQKDKQRRFPPVVRFLGAFSLEAGESKTHSIELPQYMGAVRVMVVAADNNAYGKAEKSITVTQPLTLLATLPRVLGPKEEVALPVNVFVNNNNIKEVEVKIEPSDLFIAEKNSLSFTFNEAGDQIDLLNLKVKNRIGMGSVKVIAKSGEEMAEQTIHIESRSSNPRSTVQQAKLLQPGESWQPDLLPHGMQNTNTASLAVSSFPPLNLDKRMNYLVRYPHGCVEQTTSAIFPQIWLHNLTELSDTQVNNIQNHVDEAIKKYRNFQNASGSFSYWPGGNYSNDWASNYVTHFLVEAKQLGYAVPQNMLDKALKYLQTQSNNGDNKQNYSRLVQGYRLYVLAIAGKSDLAAMNRLRETLLKNQHHYNDNIARWQLSLAYQSLGLSDVSRELLNRAKNNIDDYRYASYTYGSSLRDSAMLLMTYNANKEESLSWDQATEIASLLSRDSWYSTHSLSWAFLALSKYAGGLAGSNNQFSLSEYGQKANDSDREWQAIKSIKTVYTQSVSPPLLRDSRIVIRNDSDHPLHAQVSNSGVPSEGEERAHSQGLSMSVSFNDMEGKPLDIKALPQGQDFIAHIAIKADNTKNSYKIEDIASTVVVPSGWQIRNERLEGEDIPKGLDYQDIRDDRVLSYFSLWHNYYWYYRYNDRNRNAQDIRIVLNASFAGRFYFPGWQVKSMYDEDVMAQTVGQWVEVISENKERKSLRENRTATPPLSINTVANP